MAGRSPGVGVGLPRACVAALAVLSACASASRWDHVLGAEWVLVRMEGHPPLAGSDVAITFGPGRLYGRAVNRYGAPYARTEEDALEIGPVSAAGGHAEATPGAREQEAHYLRLLGNVDGWRITHGRLELLRGGAPVLAFLKRSALGARS